MRTGLMKRAVCCIAAAVLAAGVFSYMQDSSGILTYAEPEVSEHEQRLEELSREQEELDERIREAESKSADGREKLEAVSEKLRALETEKAELQALSEELVDRMVEADDELRGLDYQIEQQEAAIKEEVNNYSGRIRALYLAGSESFADIILTSEDFFDVLMRTELIKRVVNHDKSIIDRLLEDLRDIQDKKAQAEDKLAELQDAAAQYSERRERLEQSQAEQDLLLEQYSAELEKLGMLSDELAAKAAELEAERKAESERAEQQTAAEPVTEAPDVTTAPEVTETPQTTVPPAETQGTQPPTETVTTTTQQTTTTSATTTTKSVTETTTTAAATTTKDTSAPATTTTSKATTTTTTTKATTTTTKPPTTTTKAATTTKPAETLSNPYGIVLPSDLSADKQKKLLTVINYALSNVGGTYVLNGVKFKACDCTGLTMLSYATVGIDIPHWTGTQVQCGIEVPFSDLRPGDLVYFGYSWSYYDTFHASMYIGDGKIVHAMNSRTGIVISDLARFSIYNPRTHIRRLIY